MARRMESDWQHTVLRLGLCSRPSGLASRLLLYSQGEEQSLCARRARTQHCSLLYSIVSRGVQVGLSEQRAGLLGQEIHVLLRSNGLVLCRNVQDRASGLRLDRAHMRTGSVKIVTFSYPF